MELEIQHSIVKTNPTQVGYPPGPRRRIALIAVSAMALLTTSVLASRIDINGPGAAPADFSEAPRDVSVDREDEYAPAPVTSPQANQPIATCSLTCAPEVAALWNAVRAGGPDTDARVAALVESIRSSLGAIDDAIVAAASAMP